MPARLDITVGGVRLACYLSGPVDRPAMVLLHALGENSTSWDPVTSAFEDSFRVIAIDLRGHGESGRPGSYSSRLMRDDVVGVLNQLQLQRITLIGHSMGGVVAYLVAQQQPDRVDKLVIEDATPPFPRERPIPERPDFAVPFDWPVVPAIAGEGNEGDPEMWRELSDIAAETLLIGGGPESHVPAERLIEVSELIPVCALKTIAAGHFIHGAAPAEFNAMVTEFLGN